MSLGPCSRCGRDLSEFPAYVNLLLHQHCYKLNAEDVVRKQVEEARKKQERQNWKDGGS